MEEENEEEHLCSDLSNDQHPNRTQEYILVESNEFENIIDETAETNPETLNTMTYEDAWLVEEFDVIDALEKYKAVKINSKKLSDMRLL